jgi:hypothetical protein
MTWQQKERQATAGIRIREEGEEGNALKHFNITAGDKQSKNLITTLKLWPV